MIFNFGNLSAYGQALKTTSTDIGELSKLTSNLTLAQTANALSTKNLTTQEMAQILVNKGLTQAEAEATAAKIASTSANGVAVFSLKAYTIALWENVKAIGAWMLTNPVGWIIGLGVAFVGTTVLLDAFTETIDEQKEKIKDLKDEYSTLKKELESLNDEIERNDNTIADLEKKLGQGTITLVEEDQLRKLRLQNELLKQQLNTQEKLGNQKKAELVTENRETFNNEFQGSVEESAFINFDIGDFYTPGISSYKQAPNKNLILLAKENAERLENALLSGDENLIELLQADKTLITDELSKRSDTILYDLLEYKNNLAEVMNADGTFDDPDDQDMWDDIESWIRSIYEYTNQPGEWNTAQIRLALDTESLQNLQSELKARLDAGDLTEEDLEGFTDLNTALSEANLILEEGQSIASVFLQYLLGIAASQDDITTTKPNYFVFGEKDNAAIDAFQEKISKVDEALKGLDNNTISFDDVIDISQEMGLNVNEIDMLSDSYEGLREQLEQIIALEYDRLQEELGKLLDTGEIDQNTYDQLSNGLTLLMLSAKNTNKEFSSLSDGMSNLQSNFNSLTDAEREYEKTGKISYETIQALSFAYPELEQELTNYLSGLINEKTLIESLKESYDADLLNYKAYYAEKHRNDLDFYNRILERIPQNVKDRFAEYDADLKNYKSLAEAKLQIEKNLADEIYKQKLRENDRPIVKPWVNENYMFNEPEDPAVLRKQADEEAKELSSALDKGVELAIELPKITYTGSDKKGSGSDSATEEINEIDWAANSIENLTNKIDSLNKAIENTPGYKKQLELIKELITEEGNLLTLRENVRDEYSTRYTNSLSGFSESELTKYKPLIESTTDVSLEMFKGENRQKIFEKVSAAQETWQAYQQALADYENQVVAVANAQELKYQTEQERYQTRIDRHENEKSDIQNKISKQETRYGYADEELYQELLKENNYLLDDYNDKLENAKANRKKIIETEGRNSKVYLEADNEVQALQDSVAELTQEQVELNRTILKYPIHKLEEAKEELEEQLEVYKERQSNLESAISGASNLLQDEIDTYNDLKESVSDSYDAQIKVISDKRDALTETNDALKQQMALEQAQYNLDRALNQKTVKVIRNKQVVYEADARAIIDAQKQLDEEKYNIAVSSFDKQIKNLEEQKANALEGIDNQIERLQEYKEKIDSIVGSYERALELQAFLSLFNTDGNGIQKLLNMDDSLYGDMFNQYTDASSDVNSTEEQIRAIEETIAEIEAIATRWDGAKNTIKTARQEIEDTLKNTEAEFQAIKDRNEAAKTINKQWKKVKEKTAESLALIETDQINYKDSEKTILDERLGNIKSFADQANSYLSSVSSSIDAVNSKTINPKTSSDNNSTKGKQNSGNKNGILDNEQIILVGALASALSNFHTGMEQGFVGEISNKDDTFKHITLTKLKPDEVPTVLQVGEGVLTKLQQTNVLDNMRTAFYAGTKLPNFNNIQKANNTTLPPSISFNGDIILHGVNDVSSFATKIKSEFLTKLSQELYK